MVRAFVSRFRPCSVVPLTTACAAVPSAPAPAGTARGNAPMADGLRADVAIPETTDLHTTCSATTTTAAAPTASGGFDRVATLIRQARAEFANSLLIDDGDTLRGTALADYQTLVQRPACGQKLAMHKAMDALGYDAGTIGNHEFNYGLPFLSQVTGTPMPGAGVDGPRCTRPAYPLVLSNVFGARDGKPLYAPYAVLERRFTAYGRRQPGDGAAEGGRARLHADADPEVGQGEPRRPRHRSGHGGGRAALKLPELRARRARTSSSPWRTRASIPRPTRPSWKTPAGISPACPASMLCCSAIRTVCSRAERSASRFASMPEVDNAQGFVRGVPAVMGGFTARTSA